MDFMKFFFLIFLLLCSCFFVLFCGYCFFFSKFPGQSSQRERVRYFV